MNEQSSPVVSNQTPVALSEVLARYAPLLLIDSSSSSVFVGVWREGGGEAVWERCEEEAGVGVFRGVEKALSRADVARLADVRGFAFGEGPGSVLGIRTAATALRTWRVLNPAPVFAFQGVVIVAEALARRDLAVIVDARRDSWHVACAGQALVRMTSAELAELSGHSSGEGGRGGGQRERERVSEREIEIERERERECVCVRERLRLRLGVPEGFRCWTPVPTGAERIAYDLPAGLVATADKAFFRPTDEPEAFLYDVPQYALWTPKVHQAPGSK